MATDTATKSIITLKGSSKLVAEFFYYGINSILYQRDIYPAEDFTIKQQYGVSLFVSNNDGINQYLKQVIGQIREWLEKGQIVRLVLVVKSVATKEVLERWDFQVDCDVVENDKNKALDPKAALGSKDMKQIEREMGAVIRQITACVSFLPLLDQHCAFDLLVHTKKECAIPSEWSDSSPCVIDNCQEVRLRSFSTSVHKVKASVAYKMDG